LKGSFTAGSVGIGVEVFVAVGVAVAVLVGIAVAVAVLSGVDVEAGVLVYSAVAVGTAVSLKAVVTVASTTNVDVSVAAAVGSGSRKLKPSPNNTVRAVPASKTSNIINLLTIASSKNQKSYQNRCIFHAMMRIVTTHIIPNKSDENKTLPPIWNIIWER
jgi:hypothetical protein